MSVTITTTVTKVPDRTLRILFEKPYQGIPTIMTVDESLTVEDGETTSRLTGNMHGQYDPDNPLDVALYAALEAKVLDMRAKRDAAQGGTE